MTSDFDPAEAVRRGSAAQLSKLMALDPAEAEPWAGRDLPAMLRHQFDAPLKIDLGRVKVADGFAHNRKPALSAANVAGITCFADLLFHPQPPLELLRLSKEFFKNRTRVCVRSSPEWKVAYLFYLLTILVAGNDAPKLSTLSTKDLLKGIGWALKQSWVDEKTRELLISARKRLPA